MALGFYVQSDPQLHRVLVGLHVTMASATLAVALLCIELRDHGRFDGAMQLMGLVMALLGLSLMGMLPFCLQQAVQSARPASENVVAGLVYLVAMAFAAGLNQLCASVDPLVAVACVGGVIGLELLLYFLLEPQARATCAQGAASVCAPQRPEGGRTRLIVNPAAGGHGAPGAAEAMSSSTREGA